VTIRPLRAFFVCLLALLFAGPALAVDFPPLSGRVVDQADLLTPGQEAALTAKLEALERASSRQLVVATIASLHDLAIEDYGVQLGRHWRIGQGSANNGVVLIIAPNERKMRIEVGYGLEGIMTDALSSRIIREAITPRFRAGDYAGGIDAGADAIIEQLQAPPEAAEQRALAAQQAENRSRAGRGRGRGGGGSIFPLLIWIPVLLFIVLPLFGAGLAGRRYRGRGRRGVSIWGPGDHRAGSGLGWMLAGIALSNMSRGRGGGSWGGGGGSSWGGGGGSGGFSGGGGSFGGGGASGGW
jgi:uncharacterized protein